MRRLVPALLLLAALAPAPLRAQAPVGTFVTVGGTVEVRRGGEWLPAMTGTPVFDGETVRSAADGTTTVVFSDDSVLDVAGSTAVTIREFGGKTRRALLQLENGAVEAIVSRYGGDGPRFEIETPAAIVRVQSTQFVVRHDPPTGATEVGGIDGVVSVQGRTALIGAGVAVGPNEMSRVEVGKFPSEAKVMDPAQRAAMVAGLEMLAIGGSAGLDVDNPLLDGRTVADTERPQIAAGGTYIKPAVPDELLIDRLSPDVRANTQPIPVYDAVPPNEVPVPPR